MSFTPHPYRIRTKKKRLHYFPPPLQNTYKEEKFEIS